MEVKGEVAAVVPTLGGSGLGAALASLRRQGGALDVTVVHQARAKQTRANLAPEPSGEGARRQAGAGGQQRPVNQTTAEEGAAGAALPEEIAALADRVLAFPAPLGFAAAANAGIAVRGGRYLLLLNDDAELLPGWLAAARTVLDSSPTLAAVQGVNLAAEPTGEAARRQAGPGGQPRPVNLAAEPPGEAGGEARVEGCGIGWNRWWQAVQLGAGAAPPPGPGAREIFGASAAAVLFRGSALAAVGLASGVFDPRLHTYYEDVDLAGRLRAAGYQAALVPLARARHRGGGSEASLGGRRLSLLYANRWLALARLLGGALGGRLPRILLRDLRDAARHPGRLPAVLSGWARARRHWERFARPGPPLVPLAELRRLAAERFG